VKRQSAVFVAVAADRLVGSFREQHHPRAVRRKLPPHITVVPPFFRDLDADGELTAVMAEHFAGIPGFAARLVSVGRFRRHVWLAPDPRERFVELMMSARRRFPGLFRDEEGEPVPHLTVAEIAKGDSTRRVYELAEAELGPRLPFEFEVREVGLYEVRPDGWYEVRSFTLG
jgi:2'-5' RNA ligase